MALQEHLSRWEQDQQSRGGIKHEKKKNSFVGKHENIQDEGEGEIERETERL